MPCSHQTCHRPADSGPPAFRCLGQEEGGKNLRLAVEAQQDRAPPCLPALHSLQRSQVLAPLLAFACAVPSARNICPVSSCWLTPSEPRGLPWDHRSCRGPSQITTAALVSLVVGLPATATSILMSPYWPGTCLPAWDVVTLRALLVTSISLASSKGLARRRHKIQVSRLTIQGRRHSAC